MSREPTLNRHALVERFHTYARPRAEHRLGVELERHLLRPDTGHPVPYAGPAGVRWLLETLAPNGWEVHKEGDNPIALFRDGASITLEPGSQFELSTSPFFDVGAVEAQARAFVNEVDAAIGNAPLVQVALGYTPFAKVEQIEWVPKGRYRVMREYLAQTGALAHHMMKSTCAVQASYDFADEADCARKVQLGIKLGPLTTAMFANSPLSAGHPNGWASFRGHVWTETDPRRTGFPEQAQAFTFERWVDYLLGVPMMFFHDAVHGWRPAHGRTFGEWMTRGIDGQYPDLDAWDLHQTSVFPEVRVKRFIEVRGADCVPHALAMSMAALFEGLFYDPATLDAATEVADRFAAIGTSRERFEVACRQGLLGEIGGRKLHSWAEEVVTAAASGLDRLGEDRRWLEPLVGQVASGESPSASVLRAFAKDPSPAGVVRALRYVV